MDDFSDDYEFTPSYNSKLASLFNTASDFPESASLTYTAPKQPQNNHVPEEPKLESTVLCARVVTLWRIMVDTKSNRLGTHGLAIVGTQLPNTQELILYKDKTNIIVRVRITANFHWILKENYYCTFSDWLVRFNNEEDQKYVSHQIEKYGGKVVGPQEEKPVQTEPKVDQETRSEDYDELSSEAKARNDILHRIAKMGQSILPLQEIDEAVKTETLGEETPVPSPRHNILTLKSEPVPKELLTKPERSIVRREIPSSLPVVPSSQVILSQPFDPLNFHFAEARVQNTELRMDLTQINEKLGHLLQVVDGKAANSSAGDDSSLRKIKVLNLQIENLKRDVQRYEAENQLLKQSVANSESRADSQQKVDQLQREFLLEMEELRKKIMSNESRISEMLRIIDIQKIQLEETTKEKDILLEAQQLSEHALSEFKNTFAHLRTELEHSKAKANNNTQTIEYLKEAMNEMYNGIMANFHDSQQYSSGQIKKIVGRTIKSATLNVIKNLEQ